MAPTSTRFAVDPDIRRAETLPAEIYSDPEIQTRLAERVLARSWQMVGDETPVRAPGQVQPVTFLPGSLDEPLLLARDRNDRLRCLSNVCTHRGNLLVEAGGSCSVLRCRYHGRRFDLDGRLKSAPGFEDAEEFPRPEDHLSELGLGQWGRLLFARLSPPDEPKGSSFEKWFGPLARRLAWFPADELTLDASRSRDYLVQAHWALYVENYLEGFHIPYVHAGLAEALDTSSYATELYELSSLQLGVAAQGEPAFDLPDSSPDAGPGGQRIAAYYWWLFPNTMVNVYPWGVSVNVVLPQGPERTKVRFLTYVADPTRLEEGAGASLDRVEREDESIVEAVARGVRSRAYTRGRFSPTQERGVHHFHRLLAARL